MLPARLDDYRQTDPHAYAMTSQGGISLRANRQLRPASLRPRDVGQMGDNWRSILLDQLRKRGANFFGV